MYSQDYLIRIGIASAIIMFVIEASYLIPIAKKSVFTKGNRKRVLTFGLIIGSAGYIPFFAAFLATFASYMKWNVLSSFSMNSVVMVVVSLIGIRVINKKIGMQDNSKELEDHYQFVKDNLKTVYFINLILLGVGLGIYELLYNHEPLGFFGVSNMRIGKEILFSILPVLSYSAFDYFSAENDLKDFFTEVKTAFLGYYGFSAYLTLLVIGYVFFLNSQIYHYIFLGGTIGALAAFLVALIIKSFASSDRHWE